MDGVQICRCAMPLPINKEKSLCVNHLPIGVALTMVQDNTEVTFKDDLQTNLKCQKYLTPKDENINIIQQLKLTVQCDFSKSHYGYYILGKKVQTCSCFNS